MRAVNLLPSDVSQRRSMVEPRSNVIPLAGLAGALIVCAVLALAYLDASSKVKDRQETLDTLTAELQATAPAKPALDADPALVADRAQRISALNSALAQRVDWDRLLRQLSLVLPTNVWLTSIVTTGPAAAAGTSTDAAPLGAAVEGGSTCTIQGYTYSQQGVARLLSRLSVISTLSDVQLQSSAQTKLGQRNAYQFTIVAAVARAGVRS